MKVNMINMISRYSSTQDNDTNIRKNDYLHFINVTGCFIQKKTKQRKLIFIREF